MKRLSGNSPLAPWTVLMSDITAGPTAALAMASVPALRENAAGPARPLSDTTPSPTPQAGLRGVASRTDLRELTRGVSRGEEAAFNRFYDFYSLPLYKYLLVLAKGDESSAREVLQTVVLKVARKCKVFDEEPRLWSWLCRLARNAYVDLYRARQRDRALLPLEEHEADLAQAGEDEHRLSAALGQALESVTEEERELMRAVYVDQRPLQEIADASGQTYKALESRLGRLRQKLKTTMLRHLRHEEQ